MFIIAVGTGRNEKGLYSNFIPVDKYGGIIHDINDTEIYDNSKKARTKICYWYEKVFTLTDMYKKIYTNESNEKKIGLYTFDKIGSYNGVLEDLGVYTYAEYSIAQSFLNEDGTLILPDADKVVNEYVTGKSVTYNLKSDICIFDVGNSIARKFDITNESQIILTLK